MARRSLASAVVLTLAPGLELCMRLARGRVVRRLRVRSRSKREQDLNFLPLLRLSKVLAAVQQQQAQG
jgi:hypothetical protein